MKITANGIESSGDIKIKSTSGNVTFESPQGTVSEKEAFGSLPSIQRSTIKNGESITIKNKEYALICDCLELEGNASINIEGTGKLILI